MDWSKYAGLAVTYGTKLLGAIALLFLAWILSNWASRITYKTLSKKLDKTLSQFLSKVVKWSLLVLSVISVLGIFGVQTTSFAALIAAMGLAVGLALQGTLSHIASGVMILIFRPFKIDDVISVAGQTGKVVEIDLFNTSMDTPDNRRIIIPNSNVFGSVIENITKNDTRRVDVTVGSDYTADIETTRSELLQAAKGVSKTLKSPEPMAYLTDLGDSSINWSVRVWAATDDYWDVREELTQAVKNCLDSAEIGIPYPQLDLHLKQANLHINSQADAGSERDSYQLDS